MNSNAWSKVFRLLSSCQFQNQVNGLSKTYNTTTVRTLSFYKRQPLCKTVSTRIYSMRYGSKIYTKTGDGGVSSLFTGERRPKSDAIFDALGDIDELSSNIGLCREILSDSWQHDNFEEVSDMLRKIQCSLQDVASCVATPLSSASDKHITRTAFDGELVAEIEELIDTFTKDLPELKNFILPSGGKSSCVLHICRSVCRRAERKVSALYLNKQVDESVAKYVNRLSDFLFTMARYVASMEGQPEIIYKKPRRAKKSKNEENENNEDTDK